MTKIGLCLSGGGSKGAYEIGVCWALRRLGIKPDIVTGTSVGAINGSLIVQGDLYKAVKLWKKLSFNMIYDESSFPLDYADAKISDIYKLYAKAFIKDGGMDVEALIKLFGEVYDSKKFFLSPIDYGLVTYNLTKNKPVFITKSDLKLMDDRDRYTRDYIMASASCYPAFKPYKIDGDNYVDGGYYDNLPINLTMKMGADEIIAVDLREVGFKREFPNDIPIVTISPRNKLQSFLVFDSSSATRAINFGYNDTMKLYGKLDGDILTFKKGNLVRNYNRYSEKFENYLRSILDNLPKGLSSDIINSSVIKKYLKSRVSYKNFNHLVEQAGIIMGFAEDNIYNIKTYNKGLFNELLKISSINSSKIAGLIKKKDFKNIIDRKCIVKFFYNCICEDNFHSLVRYGFVFVHEFLIALYIYTVKGKKKIY